MAYVYGITLGNHPLFKIEAQEEEVGIKGVNLEVEKERN